MKPKNNAKPEGGSSKSDRLARALALVSIALSICGFWLSYQGQLPAIEAKTEFLAPITANAPFRFRIDVTNLGKTTARHMQPVIAWRLSRADIPFSPTYDTSDLAFHGPISDLAPGGHTRITSKNEFIADAGSLAQLQSGAWNMYVYGKIPYSDVFHIGHEAHFCGLYQVVEGADPLKLSFCPTYNDTE